MTIYNFFLAGFLGFRVVYRRATDENDAQARTKTYVTETEKPRSGKAS